MFSSRIISVLFLMLSSATEAQNSVRPVPGKIVRECFDLNWMFHKGDIAIKYTFRAAKYGGLTDVDVKVVSDESVIDYTDKNNHLNLNPQTGKKLSFRMTG